jgi:hypothetical protein
MSPLAIQPRPRHTFCFHACCGDVPIADFSSFTDKSRMGSGGSTSRYPDDQLFGTIYVVHRRTFRSVGKTQQLTAFVRRRLSAHIPF